MDQPLVSKLVVVGVAGMLALNTPPVPNELGGTLLGSSIPGSVLARRRFYWLRCLAVAHPRASADSGCYDTLLQQGRQQRRFPTS
jgi:hypothetical protein